MNGFGQDSLSAGLPIIYAEAILSCEPRVRDPALPRRASQRRVMPSWNLSDCLLYINPVAALRLLEILPTDDVLEDAAILFDCSDRSDVVLVAGHQNAAYTQFRARDLKR